LDKIEKDKLYLIWLSYKDFASLKENENQIMLGQIWRKVRQEMTHCFEGFQTNLDSIAGTFGKINLNTDPHQACGYDPTRKALVFNFWLLFFDLLNDEWCIPSPPFVTAGKLVHEFDHYCYFRDHGMIGKPEKEFEEFDKINLGALEERALKLQMNFLDNCRKNLPDISRSYGMVVTKWSKKGRPIEKRISPFNTTKEQMSEFISSDIKQLTDVINRVKDKENYSEMADENSGNICKKLMELMSLPIAIDSKKKEYPSIAIKM